MKNCIKSVIILIAGLSALASTPLSAASKFDLPIVFSVRALTATREGGDQIERGSSRAAVSWAMKRKTRQEISPDVWAYVGYQANVDLANDQHCQTLVVTFADNRVVDLQLVNKPAITVIASNLKLKPSMRSIASAR